MLPVWSEFFPSAPRHLRQGGQERAPGSTCTVAAEWQCGWHLLLSLLPQHSDPLLSVPLGHSSPLTKESGKMGLEDVGTGGEQDGKRAADPAAGHGLLLLLHGLAKVLCPEQRAQSKCF